MRPFDRAVRILARVVTPEEAHAHCDVPCGIYDPHQAQVAALTILRMNQLIRDLPKPDAHAPADEVETHDAKLGRFIASKEEHAEMCKRELRILWGDYFNPTHLEQHPNVHDLFWECDEAGFPHPAGGGFGCGGAVAVHDAGNRGVVLGDEGRADAAGPDAPCGRWRVGAPYSVVSLGP